MIVTVLNKTDDTAKKYTFRSLAEEKKDANFTK